MICAYRDLNGNYLMPSHAPGCDSTRLAFGSRTLHAATSHHRPASRMNKTAMSDRKLPASLPRSQTSERAILSCFLHEPALLDNARESLPPEAFYCPAERYLYDLFLENREKGLPVEYAAVFDLVEQRGALDKIVGPALLAEVLDFVPGPTYYSYYKSELLEHKARRDLCQLGHAVLSGGMASAESPLKFIEQASDQLQKMGAGLAQRSLPPARGILHFYETDPDQELTLLGNRFLCAGGGMVFIGPSGVGKSSASTQQDACFALGLEAFGIPPARPLKMLTVQAENDDGDLTEMVRGVLDGVVNLNELSGEQRDLLNKNCKLVTINDQSGDAFLRTLDHLLAQHKPDIVRIDPLLAFLGSDPVDTEKLSRFLRAGLNPLLVRHQCAVIINHHTPKVTNRDTSKWSALDFSYSGAGSSELTNWARSILVIDHTADEHVFNFIAAKRGRRIGWRDPFGCEETRRMFEHSRKPGCMCWEEASESSIQSAEVKRGKYDVRKMILDMVPLTAPIPKEQLVIEVNMKGPGTNAVRNSLKALLEADAPQLFQWKEWRSGTNSRVIISRSREPRGE